MNRIKNRMKQFPVILMLLALIPLSISIAASGYSYQFDSDELHHVQLIYLYANGVRPYLDIYNSVYTPVFEWFLLPLYRVAGFSFDTIYQTRYVMIVLFAIRVLFSFLIVRKVFGNRTALLFAPLFLLDPFVVFSSMQIRPDNFMMTVFTIGVYLFVRAITNPAPRAWFLTGLTIAFSALILPKIVPSVGLFALAGILFCLKKKFRPSLPAFLLGGLLVPASYVVYFALNGSLGEMLTQSVFEAGAAYSYFPVHIPLGNFYIPDNAFVYGMMGKPLTWFYAWGLPYAAAAGVYITLASLLTKQTPGAGAWIKGLLVASLGVQWLALFFLQVVFMQHYLPISWLYALFTAVLLNQVLILLEAWGRAQKIALAVLMCGFLALVFVSVKANTTRAQIDAKWTILGITNRWKQIPPNTPTFPNFLFRPLIYPVPYGYFVGNVPPVILGRLPPIIERLKHHSVQYLLIDDYLMSKLPPDVSSYILTNYARIPGDTELMIPKQ